MAILSGNSIFRWFGYSWSHCKDVVYHLRLCDNSKCVSTLVVDYHVSCCCNFRFVAEYFFTIVTMASAAETNPSAVPVDTRTIGQLLRSRMELMLTTPFGAFLECMNDDYARETPNCRIMDYSVSTVEKKWRVGELCLRLCCSFFFCLNDSPV